ncbi:MAG: redoxin domain-containing protein [Bacteroidota bacterium]
MNVFEDRRESTRARELCGDYWLNGGPLPLAAHRGQTILLFFWDFTCVHSLQILPAVSEWDREYRGLGLLSAGVHTPRFPFGREPGGVETALRRHGVDFPVVLDNQGLIAAGYGVSALPAFRVVDHRGAVRFCFPGDVHLFEVEHALRALLHEAGPGRELPLPRISRGEGARGRAAADLLMGYGKGSLGNVEGYSPEAVVRYEDPGIYLEGRFYAAGCWQNGRDCLRFDPAQEGEGRIVVSHRSAEVAAVIRSEETPQSLVEVLQDGAPLEASAGGGDIRRTADGRTLVRVREGRAYSLILNGDGAPHLLQMITRSGGCAFYALMFSPAGVSETAPR